MAPAVETLNELYVFCDTPENTGAMLTVCWPLAPVTTDVAVPPSGTIPAANTAPEYTVKTERKIRTAHKPPLPARRVDHRLAIVLTPLLRFRQRPLMFVIYVRRIDSIRAYLLKNFDTSSEIFRNF